MRLYEDKRFGAAPLKLVANYHAAPALGPACHLQTKHVSHTCMTRHFLLTSNAVKHSNQPTGVPLPQQRKATSLHAWT